MPTNLVLTKASWTHPNPLTTTIKVIRHGASTRTARLIASGRARRQLQVEQRCSQMIRKLNSEDREAVREMDEDEDVGADGDGFESYSIFFEDAFNSPPPGEEGAVFSDNGGEYGIYGDLVSRVREAATKQSPYDYRTCKDRTQRCNEGWNNQLNQSATAYLERQQDPYERTDEVDPGEEHDYRSLVN
ncbi:hypothetical protein M422DRAFT_54476 [Sphaerobolus stellatus SS14]|uniref:Uncharacterized protein n=1 Tax=Sphaerobolus stellatus (strain SS14) TaxID=990650 RepID=A0A0C9UIN5_SPHS4|nr:hypothetical protein M422DRAFT_54476 [Sphaerobolus stellatus SS14]